MSSFRKPVILLRKQPGGFNNYGEWIEGEAEETSIKASIQPLSLKEMETLPEGQRSSNLVKVYTDTEVHPAVQGGKSADIIIWRDKQWEVLSCAAYQMGVIPHYKAIAAEVMPDAT